MAQPSQLFHVSIGNAPVAVGTHQGCLHLNWGLCSPNAGIVPHIHQTLDTVMPEQFDKIFKTAGRMSDCEYHGRFWINL